MSRGDGHGGRRDGEDDRRGGGGDGLADEARVRTIAGVGLAAALAGNVKLVIQGTPLVNDRVSDGHDVGVLCAKAVQASRRDTVERVDPQVLLTKRAGLCDGGKVVHAADGQVQQGPAVPLALLGGVKGSAVLLDDANVAQLVRADGGAVAVRAVFGLFAGLFGAVGLFVAALVARVAVVVVMVMVVRLALCHRLGDGLDAGRGDRGDGRGGGQGLDGNVLTEGTEAALAARLLSQSQQHTTRTQQDGARIGILSEVVGDPRGLSTNQQALGHGVVAVAAVVLVEDGQAPSLLGARLRSIEIVVLTAQVVEVAQLHGADAGLAVAVAVSGLALRSTLVGERLVGSEVVVDAVDGVAGRGDGGQDGDKSRSGEHLVVFERFVVVSNLLLCFDRSLLFIPTLCFHVCRHGDGIGKIVWGGEPRPTGLESYGVGGGKLCCRVGK